MRILDKVLIMNKRLTPDARKTLLLKAAISVASKGHYKHITRKQIAEAAGTSGPLVKHYLGPMDKLGDVLMAYAVENRQLWVLAQGIIAEDPIALAAPDELKDKARGVLPW